MLVRVFASSDGENTDGMRVSGDRLSEPIAVSPGQHDGAASDVQAPKNT